MTKNILVMSSLDTKGKAVEFLVECIRGRGHNPIILDLSLMKKPKLKPDIPSVEVAIAGGGSEADTKGETGERWKRIELMVCGATKIVNKMIVEGRIDGLVGIGGATIAGIVSRVSKNLPLGFPKLIVSSVAGLAKYDYIGRSDIGLLACIVDTDAMNILLKSTIAKAAGMICGAAESEVKPVSIEFEQLKGKGAKVIAMTQLFAAECASAITDMLKEKGNYEVITFHAQGIGDSTMEDLIESGANFDAVIDLCIAGVSEHLLGGNRAAKPTRLEAAGKWRIPQIITPVGLDVISCGPLDRRDKSDPLWEKRRLADRKLWIMDEQRVQAKISPEEAIQIAKVIASKLNDAKAPVKFLVPWQGWAVFNRKGGDLYEPETDQLLINRLKEEVDPKVVELREYDDLYLNSYEFARIVIDTLEEVIKEGGESA